MVRRNPAGQFLIDHFEHTPIPGPYRYVGQVYRHAGITARGINAFATFLRVLLKKSPTILRSDYEAALDDIDAPLVRPFLVSRAGFEFTKQTAAFLTEHHYRGRSREWLKGLSGYRDGFWDDLLATYSGESPAPEGKHAPSPRLCLDLQTARVVLRFDPTWLSRGAYLVDGNRVRHQEHPVGGRRAPKVEIVTPARNMSAVDPWWTPSVSPWALFRSSDGALIHIGGVDGSEIREIRPDSYVFVGPESLAPPGDDFGWLDVSESDADALCALRQFTLGPESALEQLRIRSLSRERQLPSISFDLGAERGNGGVFYGALPAVRILNWDHRAATRYRLVHDVGDRVSDIEVRPGTERIRVETACPARGSIRLEYLGVDYGRRLPTLTYTVLPRWAEPTLLTRDIGPLDEARVRLGPCEDSWCVSDTDRAVADSSGDWRLPIGAQSWTPTVSGPSGFSATVHLDIPLWSAELSVPLRSGILTESDVKPLKAVPFVVRGRSWGRASVAIRQDGAFYPLLSEVELGQHGRRVMTVASCLDQLETCPHTVGHFVVTSGNGVPHAQKLVWLHLGRLANLLTPLGKGESPSTLGDWEATLESVSRGLAKAVGALFNIDHRAVGYVELDPVAVNAPALLPAAAGRCLMAAAIDGTRCDRDEDELLGMWLAGRPASGDELVRLRNWWVDADAMEPSATLRVPRWEAARDARRNERRVARHLPTSVSEFRQAVLDHLPERSPFQGLVGHGELFQGAERYMAAMKLSGERRQIALGNAGSLLDAAVSLATPCGPVHSIARILRTAVHIRRGRRLDSGYFDELAGDVAVSFAPALQDLATLHAGELLTEGGGIRLSHVSPANEDAPGL